MKIAEIACGTAIEHSGSATAVFGSEVV